ncbi:DnaB-like helicase C-terminal domain-containing protein [Caldimonas brevitalea]|uniref:DNA primase/helicase n=1 Tax=Caldimonas brevitalea TaxID=413882 RepID=A0A0G3BLF1_9BURK|nr:DnaB-like helicase C-terminal domain-containing protein [Caldimonas brevitalea]AKJ28783.1 DNA primase/helicase [Caldimonas brevitalea]
MRLISDTIDLSAYKQGPDLAVKVRKASDFRDAVQARRAARNNPNGKRHARMLSGKAQNLLEFRPGETTAWAGYNGHRKSMFTGQIAVELALQRERVLIASFEMLPADTMDRAERQALATGSPTEAQSDLFYRWADDRLWLFDHLGRVDAETCLALCRYFADELQGTQVFIDSMMMVCDSEERLDEQKRFTTDIVRCGMETGLHMHLIVHCRKPPSGTEDKPPTKYDIKGSGSISDQVHNVMTVWANKPKERALERDPNDMVHLEQPDALVTCEKQRNGPWEGRLKFWFDKPTMRFCDDRHSRVEPYNLGAIE